MALNMLKPVIICILALLLTAAKGWAGELAVIEGYAPKSLTPTASSAAVYFTLSNQGAADRIIAVSTPSAGSAMIHESKILDGVATMDMLASVDVPANSTVKFEQGGLHVMLAGLKAPLKEGDTLTLELVLERAGSLKVQVPVTGLKGPAAATTPSP